MIKHLKKKNPELEDIIRWLEKEIDLCLSWDLPITHLELQLQAAEELYYAAPLPLSRYSH